MIQKRPWQLELQLALAHAFTQVNSLYINGAERRRRRDIEDYAHTHKLCSTCVSIMVVHIRGEIIRANANLIPHYVLEG